MAEVKISNQETVGKIKSPRLTFRAETTKDKHKKEVNNILKRYGGKFVELSNEDYGLLIGGGIRHYEADDMFPEEDVICLVLLDSNRNIFTVNYDDDTDCIECKELDSIPSNFSILSYLYRHDKQSVVDRIEYQLETPQYRNLTMFTNICIRVPNGGNNNNYSKRENGQKRYKNHRSKNAYNNH